MDMGIKDRVALVAGASKGLGKAVAQGLAAEGCHLALCARNQKALAQAAQELSAEFKVRVFTQGLDLADGQAAAAFAQEAQQRLGSVDILVNNAGGPPAGSFVELEPAAWQKAVDLTLFSAQALTRAVLPGMRQRRWGRVVNLTSISVKQPLPGLILSNSIRAAVVGWAKTLADEVGADQITVNNVCTGWTLTERVEELLAHRSRIQGVSREEALATVVTDIPLGRVGRPEELAALVVFLASEQASYITGVSYAIDGGLCRSLT
ncbi:MAG: SDR family oxidoreductase [Thermodesulfobacteriota bacterium]